MQFSIFAKYSINFDDKRNSINSMILNINFFFSINEYFQCDCFTRYIFDIDIFIVAFRKLYEFYQKHYSFLFDNRLSTSTNKTNAIDFIN